MRRPGIGGGGGGEELRDALDALWSAWETREGGDDIPRREGRQKRVEDEDVCCARASGGARACEVVESLALRAKAVEDQVEAFCELEEVAR
jgi:hypothetical protein